MKYYYVKTQLDYCESLEEAIIKRNYINNWLISNDTDKEMTRLIRLILKRDYNIETELQFKIKLDAFVNFYTITISHISNKELEEIEEKLIKVINGQLSDGFFENFDYIDWNIEKF